jgi:hypothetical protein
MRRGRKLLLLPLLILGCAAAAARAAESGAIVSLEVASRVGPDEIPEAAPARFTLFEDGQVYVGGSSGLVSGRLEKSDMKDIETGIDRVRKLPGLGAAIRFGPGERRARLVVRKGRPLDIVATGDPAVAPASLRPIASLISSLESFSHPSLRPFRPPSYLAKAREGKLVGGCRAWGPALPALADLLAAPRVVAAEAVLGWPTGAIPASVCAGAKKYVVTFRPMLPGERP